MKITQSKKLRNNLNQHGQKNKESKLQDNNIKNVINDICDFIKETYSLEVGIDSTLPIDILEKIVNDNCKKNTTSSVKPDGGLVWVKINNKKYYILISEQKKQGTNDERIMEVKEKQATGNAIERLGKNVFAFETLFGDEDIFPFVVFIQGCDFCEEESTIPDRVRTIMRFQDVNKINLYWRQISKHQFFAGSYFMRGHSMYEAPSTSDWTYQEMYDICIEIAEKSIRYYLQKEQD
jgi:type II restriction enzyme